MNNSILRQFCVKFCRFAIIKEDWNLEYSNLDLFRQIFFVNCTSEFFCVTRLAKLRISSSNRNKCFHSWNSRNVDHFS